MSTKTMTPIEALAWLVGLKRRCLNCNPVDDVTLSPIPHCKNCGGTGEVPVLNLLEPCPPILLLLRLAGRS